MPVDKIKMKMNNSVTRDVYEVIRKTAKEYPYKVDVVFDDYGSITVRFRSEAVPGRGEALSVGGKSTGTGQMLEDAERMAKNTWKKMLLKIGRMINIEWDDMETGNTRTVVEGTLGSNDLYGAKMASELIRIVRDLVSDG